MKTYNPIRCEIFGPFTSLQKYLYLLELRHFVFNVTDFLSLITVSEISFNNSQFFETAFFVRQSQRFSYSLDETSYYPLSQIFSSLHRTTQPTRLRKKRIVLPTQLKIILFIESLHGDKNNYRHQRQNKIFLVVCRRPIKI